MRGLEIIAIIAGPFAAAGLVFFLSFVSDTLSRKRPLGTLRRVAELLELPAPADESCELLTGRHRDVSVSFAMRIGWAGKSKFGVTEVSAEAPTRSVRLLIGHTLLKQGDHAGLKFGDAAFDQRYRVEGAPEALLRQLFSAELRAQLLAIPWITVTIGDGLIRCSVTSWRVSSEQAQAMVEVVSLIAHGLVAANEGMQAAPGTDGAPYRAEVGDRARGEQEIEDWDRAQLLHLRRTDRWIRLVVYPLLAAIAVFVGLLYALRP